MSTRISYSDFLKEGALKEKRQIKPLESEEEKAFRLIPEDINTEADEKAFWKRLRHFFRTGERPEGRNGIFVPALIAPYLRHGNWDTEYPYYLAQETATSQSLESLLQTTCNELFAENEARVLRKFLPKLVIDYRKQIEGAVVEFDKATKKAFESFLKLEIHDEEGERFRANTAKLQAQLPTKGHLLDFHFEVPLLLFRQKLEQIEWNRNQFKVKLKEKLVALEEKLAVESQKSGKEEADKGFGFAHDMIALDKVQDMLPKRGSAVISKEHLERVSSIIKQLRDAIDSHENHAHIIVNENMKDDYRWNEIFTSSTLSFAEQNKGLALAQKMFDRNMGLFTQALIALRKAELELDNAYNATVHDDYFQHFKWFKLSEDELSLFPPIMVFTNSADLTEHSMSELSQMMSTNKPIKVIAFMDRTVNPTNPDIDWEDASLTYRQELAAAALAHRNVHTLQCASDRPNGLLNGIRSGVSSTAPSLMHLMVTREEDEPHISFLKINAAAAGRYFPYLMYDPNKGQEWGSRFDIQDNSQPEEDWPMYPFTYQAADGSEQVLDLAFTYADYKAMNQVKVEELFMVPEGMVNDYLVPLYDYLYLSQEEQTGKVPYIWLVDEENVMIRAAVPYMWVSSCLERLDFWNFIQELGGVNNYHVRVVLEQAKAKWEADRKAELAALEAQHEDELAATRRDAAGEAMDKLSAVLLNLDHLDTRPTKASSPTPQVSADKADELIQEAPEVAEEEEEDEIGEAYIESFRCTSCNDCTEKYPAIFDYNEDRQAYVKDASKGTFEQLVMAAENCPAACIHPGKPIDPSEANLDELIQRAAKFQ